MGQRELLLMLLASIITTLAIFAGLRIYNNQALNFDENAYTEIMMDIAEQAQAWYIKPTQLGGGNYDYSKIDFNQVRCPLHTGFQKNCSDESRDHQIFLTNIEAHHLSINTILKFRNKVYFGEVDIKADTSIIIVDWRGN